MDVPARFVRPHARALALSARGVVAAVLVCGLCMLNLIPPAFADNGGATFAEHAIRPNVERIDSAQDDRLAIPAFRFATQTSPLLTLPANPNFEVFHLVPPLGLTGRSLALVAPVYAVPRAALPRASSSSRKGWLALGVAGLVVTGAGVGAYAAGHSGICSGANPSSGCHTTSNIGIALMPIGAVMAVAGFVMHSRH